MADHDVEIRFLGDADDAALATEELMAMLEGIKELAESLTRSLSKIEIAPSTVARFVAEAQVMESALEDIENQAEDTQRAISGIALESTISTLIGAAAAGRPIGSRTWSAPQGGAPGTALERYSPVQQMLLNRVFATTGSYPQQAAPYPYGPWADRNKASEVEAERVAYVAAMTKMLGRGPGDYYMSPGGYKFTPDQMTPLRRAGYWEAMSQIGGGGDSGGGIGAGGGGAPSEAAAVSLLAAMGMGHGGGGGGRMLGMPGWAGYFARMFGGIMPTARFGSPLALAGMGAERVVGSTLGILGSAVGGLAVGGGLYGLGIGGTAAVGMGTDMAGIGQAAGDISGTSKAYANLSQAIAIYGKNSTEAQRAQQQLNYTLAGFSPVARAAVLQASMTGNAVKSLFDRFTGPAESTGAQIISSGMQTGAAFLPTLGRFAAENMKIIQSSLTSKGGLFDWMKQGGTGNQAGGLGIFTQLEQLFQNRLPTAVHAGSQGFEVFAHAVLDAANRTGDLLPKIDAFLSKMNTPAGLQRMDTLIGHMMGLFRSWAGLIVEVGHTLVDLFAPAVHLGQDFANQLTALIGKFRQWLELGSTQSSLHSLFEAHRAQMDAIFAILQQILPFAEAFLGTLMRIETVMARFTVGPLKLIADILNTINRIPFATTLIGWAAAMLVVYKGASLLFDRVTAGATTAAAAYDKLAASAAVANAEMAGTAVAGEAAAGGSLLSRLPFGAAIGTRAAGMRVGLMGGLSRILPGAMLGFLGGSVASSIVTPMLGGHPQAQSMVGNTLTYAGIGAGIGSAIPGVGTLAGGVIGGLAGLGVSLLGMNRNTDTAADRILTFARAAQAAAIDLRNARATIRQSHLNITQDKVSRDQQAQQIAQDRVALRGQKRGTVGYLAANDTLNADLAIYGDTLRRIAADERQLAAAHAKVTAEAKKGATAHKQMESEVVKAANDMRHAWTASSVSVITLSAAQRNMNYLIDTYGKHSKIAALATAHYNALLRQDAAEKASARLAGFVHTLQDVANKAKDSDPHLYKVYTRLIQIFDGMKQLPSSKEIDILLNVRTNLTGAPAGPLGPLGSAEYKKNIAALDAKKQAQAQAKAIQDQVNALAGSTGNGPLSNSGLGGGGGGGTGGGGGGGGGGAPAAPSLPTDMQGAIDRAATTKGMADDLSALRTATAWVQAKIAKLVAAHASLTKLDPYYQMLSGLQSQIGGFGSSAWSALTSQFDSTYGQNTAPGDQLAKAQQVLRRDRLAVQLDKAQSKVLGGTPDSSMAMKVINDLAGVLASPGGKKQKYTQQEIDNWLALWGDYYAAKGMTPRQMYEAFNKLLRKNGLPEIDNPFSTGGLPLPPGVGSAERAAATMPLHPHQHRVHHHHPTHQIHHQRSSSSMRLPAGSVTSTNTQPDVHVVELKFENGMEWLEEFLTVKVDGVVKKQGVKANHRARSGRF